MIPPESCSRALLKYIGKYQLGPRASSYVKDVVSTYAEAQLAIDSRGPVRSYNVPLCAPWTFFYCSTARARVIEPCAS